MAGTVGLEGERQGKTEDAAPVFHLLQPEFAAQLDFFLARAAEVKRFLCRGCGLKLSDIFFVCPRCQYRRSTS